MSWWFYEGRKIMIKAEYQREFAYLYNGEYEKITNPVLLDFLRKTFFEDAERCIPIKELSDHGVMKEEWGDRFITTYRDGIFTYGAAYNHRGWHRDFMIAFHDLVHKITEKVLDQYDEDDGG